MPVPLCKRFHVSDRFILFQHEKMDRIETAHAGCMLRIATVSPRLFQEAGCHVHAGGHDPFDCNAALNNFVRATYQEFMFHGICGIHGIHGIASMLFASICYGKNNIERDATSKSVAAEAWSPSKKHWCCTQRGKGCEGSSPPAVDAGFGMVWKHVQAGRVKKGRFALFWLLPCWLVVSYFENASRANWIAITSLERTKVNGYWTWQAVHAAGGIHTKLPYDCHAGRQNWHIGWSAPKKARRES